MAVQDEIEIARQSYISGVHRPAKIAELEACMDRMERALRGIAEKGQDETEGENDEGV